MHDKILRQQLGVCMGEARLVTFLDVWKRAAVINSMAAA